MIIIDHKCSEDKNGVLQVYIYVIYMCYDQYRNSNFKNKTKMRNTS